MVDLNADIVPGISAAGFRIGQTFAEIQATELSGCVVREWDRSQGQIGEAIVETSGWLLSDLRKLSAFERRGTRLWFGQGALCLAFNAEGVLFEITCWSGYEGHFAEAIRIGDRLDKVLQITSLVYDDGDEVHYPTEESSFKGIGFVATPMPLEDAPDQAIIAISVHDWSLQ